MNRFLLALVIPTGILAFMVLIIASMAVLLMASGKVLAPAVAIVLAAVVMAIAAMLADRAQKPFELFETASAPSREIDFGSWRSNRFLMALVIPVGVLAFMALIISAMAVLLTASGKDLAPAVAIVLAAVVMAIAAMLADRPPKPVERG